MAYINKENLVKDVQRNLIPGTDEHGEVSEGQATRYFLSLINKQPVADVVEVVRCKDCEYWHKTALSSITGYHTGECHCLQWDNDHFSETSENDFCSYGERRIT